MKIYSIDEHTKELLVGTLRTVDMLDAVTPSIPYFSVVADTEFLMLNKNEALVLTGETSLHQFIFNDIGVECEVFTVSKNLKVVEDHRGEKYFSTVDGSEVEIKELGPLPENITTESKPSGFYVWGGESWAEDIDAKNGAQIQQNIAFLTVENQRINSAIAPLDDAIEFEIATDDEIARHKELRKYRILLSRVPNQPDWPLEAKWPDVPEF